MAKSKGKSKNAIVLVILLIVGVVLGSFLSSLASSVKFLSWLSFGGSFGLKSPLVLDIGILILTFGLTLKVTIGSIVGVAIAIIIYRLI